MLRPPTIVAHLPRSVNGAESIKVSEVFSLNQGKKRKRSELAVAVDHEGIEVYNIRDSLLVTSYAVPPESTFSCSPCSILTKDSGERLTYVALEKPRYHVKCFRSNENKHQPIDQQLKPTNTYLNGNQSPVVSLQFVDFRETEQRTLIAVHQDGSLQCFSADLSQERWRADSCFKDGKVRLAEVFTLEQAQAGVLKSRHDVFPSLCLNQLQPDVENDAKVLVIVSEMASALSLHTLAIYPRSPESDKFSVGCGSISQHLLTALLPNAGIGKTESLDLSLHRSSKSLYHSGTNGFVEYDLTCLTPSISRYIIFSSPASSSLPLSPSMIASADAANLSLIDVRYNALKGSGPVELSGRNHTQDSQEGSQLGLATELLSFYGPLQTLVARQQRTLILFDLTGIAFSSPAGCKRTRSGKLIDAIGRGRRVRMKSEKSLEILPRGLMKNPQTSTESLESFRSQLAQCGSARELDELLQQHWQNSEVSNNISVNKRKVSTILTTLFSSYPIIGTDGENVQYYSLEIKFFAKATLTRLLEIGSLSQPNIESALKANRVIPLSSQLLPSALVDAFVTHDQSLKILSDYLRMQPSVSAIEMMAALQKAFARSQRRDEKQTLQIADAEITKARSATEVNGVGGHIEYDSGKELLEENLHLKLPSNMIVDTCIERLDRVHESDVRLAFKEIRNPQLVLWFIDTLRLRLATNCWLLSADQFRLQTDEGAVSPSSIVTIARLLNCAIDSLGVGAWLRESSYGGVLNPGGTIAHVKEEISAALEGIEEAAYLQGILHEALLFAKTVPPSREDKRLDEVGSQKPIVVSSEDRAANILPVGLKGEADVVDVQKVEVNGNVTRRSMRTIGMLKSQKIGPYSFERILI